MQANRYQPKLRVDWQIRAYNVRVISQDGNNLGIMPLNQAVAKAQEAGLNLIEISPTARPPVCKIMDYGKFKYQEARKKQESKGKNKPFRSKEIKLRLSIEPHDLNVKIERARRFLKNGNRVVISLWLRGRENERPDMAHLKLGELRENLSDCSKPLKDITQLGHRFSLILDPAPNNNKPSPSHSTTLGTGSGFTPNSAEGLPRSASRDNIPEKASLNGGTDAEVKDNKGPDQAP